jgi:hypothetical protein
MARPTTKNFYNGKSDSDSTLRQALEKKDEELRIIQDKYDKLYISTHFVTQARARRIMKPFRGERGCYNANCKSCRWNVRAKGRNTSKVRKG